MKRTRLPLMLFAVALLIVSLATWINTAGAEPITYIPVPNANVGLIYNGTEQTGVDDGDDFSLTGETATIAGTHTAIASLDDPENTEWVGGGTGDKSINWVIAPKPITVPTANGGLIYNASEQTGVNDGDDFSLMGETATIAGTHTAIAILDDPVNTEWVGGSSGNKSINWVITPKPITVPTANGGLIYNASEQTGVDDGPDFSLTGETATIAGTHTAIASLDDPVNTEWVGGGSGNKSINWVIAPKLISVPTANGGIIFNSSLQTGVDDGDDFSLTGETATIAGTHTAIAILDDPVNTEWVGGGSGNKSINWVIAPKQITPPTANTPQAYDGTVKTGVANGVGYSLTGNTATNAGPYTATASLDDPSNTEWSDDTTADKSYDWTITRASLPTITAPADVVYTGLAITPDVVMTNVHTGNLVKDTDYTLAYVNNVNKGTATVTVNGKNNYIGTGSVSFDITAATLPAINSIASQTYTGNEIEPGVTFDTLMPVTTNDYTLAYSNNINKGTATVTATGKGNYTGTSTKTFQITAASLPVPEPINDQTYTGLALTPEVVLFNTNTVPRTQLIAGTDYSFTYKNNVNVHEVAGPAAVVVTGLGNYAGSTVEKTFNIMPHSLPAIAAIPNQIYTGRQLKPAVIMTNEAVGYTLVKDRDFTVAYANSIDGGMINSSNTPPVVTVTGINNYKLSKSVTFTILDNQASVFDEANASHTNGHMYIKVEDNWGLKYVKVTRNNQIIQEQWLNDILNPAYSFNVTFVQPGSYQLYATDLYNNEKVLYDMPLYVGDSDNDGLANGYERSINTDPLNPDTDGDGLSDGEEVLRLGTKPLIADTDGDGMSDMEEQSLGLNPRSSDSDSDGIADKLDVLLRALLSAHDFNSTAAMEILLNTNRGGIQPALDSTRRAKALEDLVIINYLDELLNNFKLELGKNKVLFTPANGLGDPLTMNANDRNAMLFKLNAQDNRFYSMHQGTLLEYRRDDKGNLAIVNALNLALLSDEDGKPAFVYSDESQDNFDTPVVMSDRAGTLFLVGSWSRSQSKVTQDLLLIDPVTYKVYRIPGSAGATHFGVAPTGSKVAYILDGKPVIIDLEAANMFTLDSEARFLNFTEKGDLIIDLKGGKATVVGNDGKESQIDYEGILNVQQPTNNYRSLLFIKDGIETPFSFAASANVDLLLSQIRQRAQVAINGVEPAVPEYNSVRLFDPKDSTSPKIRVSLLKDFAK